MALVPVSQTTSSSNSTTSPSHHRCHYDVFLSFRGDTRKTFTDHLYTAFVDQGFHTFRDDDEIERGEDINPELQRAIQHSRSSVIVFSKEYASSTWCLDELLMILQLKSTSHDDHVVLPVFYDVDPTQVRKQTGSFAKAFARHQKSSRCSNKVKQWRAALSQVADLAGMVLQNEADGYESKFIKKIVKVIGGRLRRTPLREYPKMIGIHSQTGNINLWLQDGSIDVGILAIYGMPGIGKTTIAKFVYDTNLRRFERSSFLANIREISKLPNGLVEIQTQLLSDILNRKKVKVQSVSEGMTKIGDAISSKRVLLVLDDVDHMDQLDAVLRMKHQFLPGSRIIVTTRRERLSKAHHLVTKVHHVETLDHNQSLELFSWHAFGQDHPIEGYVELSKKGARHCGGHPLALKLIGSSLRGESVDVWKSALKKLEAIPNSEIMNELKISYDSLQDGHDRNLFLHIACFFIGMDKDYIVRILDECEFYTIVGIQNLIDRCLVTIDENDKVQMHDMIRDMGRGIVRLESEDPEKRSRLWHHKDSFKVFRQKNGTQAIEGLVLNMHMHRLETSINTNEIVFETNAFARMHKLRLLCLSYVQLNGCYEEFPTGLRWLCWVDFPLDTMPINFPLESLVVLEMQYSSLKQVWKKGTKCLPSLKILDLSHSHGITENTDFSFCPNLEKLILINCSSLIHVHESIGGLERLVYLNIKDCINIRMLPENMFLLKALETLIISGCSNLNEFQMEMMRNLESLKVFETDGIPLMNQFLTTSVEVNSWPGRSLCIFWTSLPHSLVSLSLRGCNLKDDAFLWDFGNLSLLQRLDLSANPICSLPNCIKGIARLRELSFKDCTLLKSLEELPKVQTLLVPECTSLEKITFQSILCEELNTTVIWRNRNLVEFGHRFKCEPIGRVDVEMINLLGLCNLESMSTIQINWYIGTTHPGTIVRQSRPIQGVYEYGIFSTFLPGNKVPGRFSHKTTESFISFIAPNLKIRGLNVFVVYAKSGSDSSSWVHDRMIIKVRNKSKGVKWIYGPKYHGLPDDGEDMIWLSHWKMENQFEGGDKVVVSVLMGAWFQVKEWGINVIVHEEEENITSSQHNTTEDDPCYPFVISADLSKYEHMPGTYLLFWRSTDWQTNFVWKTWINKLVTDSDEDTDKEEEEDQLQLQDDRKVTATRGGDNKCGLRGWKGIIMAAGFFLSLSLFARSSFSRRRKQQSTIPP